MPASNRSRGKEKKKKEEKKGCTEKHKHMGKTCDKRKREGGFRYPDIHDSAHQSDSCVTACRVINDPDLSMSQEQDDWPVAQIIPPGTASTRAATCMAFGGGGRGARKPIRAGVGVLLSEIGAGASVGGVEGRWGIGV